MQSHILFGCFTTAVLEIHSDGSVTWPITHIFVHLLESLLYQWSEVDCDTSLCVTYLLVCGNILETILDKSICLHILVLSSVFVDVLHRGMFIGAKLSFSRV